MAPPRKDNNFRRPWNPKYGTRRVKMWSDCLVLLCWASRNRNMEASITVISEATNIPRMTLHWILTDWADRGDNSLLARAAAHWGFQVYIYPTWNTRDAHKRRKKIIDAVKICEPYDG